MSSLLDDLLEYDGRAMTLLGEIQARHGGQRGYETALISLSGSDAAHVSDGATWLLKAHLEQGRTLAPTETRKLLDQLPSIMDWPAQLHVCQFLEYLDLPEDQAAAVALWLEPLLRHQRPFLRAWSMSALQVVAGQHLAFAKAARSALDGAEGDQAASVRARARQVRSRQKRNL